MRRAFEVWRSTLTPAPFDVAQDMLSPGGEGIGLADGGAAVWSARFLLASE
jgi:hypothetical protein